MTVARDFGIGKYPPVYRKGHPSAKARRGQSFRTGDSEDFQPKGRGKTSSLIHIPIARPTAYLPTTKGRTDAWRRYADDPAMLLHLTLADGAADFS